MKLAEVLMTGALACPWPVAISAVRASGHRMSISPLCQKKCGTSLQCHSSDVSSGEHACQFGLSFYRHAFDDERITVFGVRGSRSKDNGNRVIKDALRGRTVTEEEFRAWLSSIEKLFQLVSNDFLSRQAEMLDPLHDPIRLARQIHQLSETIALSVTRSANLDEAINKASPELKSLVKAADLLNDSFELLTIYFNPDSAGFSRKYYLSLHGLLRKLVSIFSIGDPLDLGRESPNIYLTGSFHRNVLMHESFKLVPFALITNAIKYSIEGSVRVVITELASTVEVAVESVGPLIEPDEIPHIFKKRYRGKWAGRHSSGSGVGLYLADIVAKANGFTIRAMSKPKGGQTANGIPIATNRFSFELDLRHADIK